MSDVRIIDMLVCLAHAKLAAAKQYEAAEKGTPDRAVAYTLDAHRMACTAEAADLTARIAEYRKAGVE